MYVQYYVDYMSPYKETLLVWQIGAVSVASPLAPHTTLSTGMLWKLLRVSPWLLASEMRCCIATIGLCRLALVQKCPSVMLIWQAHACMLVAIQPGTSWWYRVVLFDVSTLTPAFCIPYEFPIWNRNGIILVRFVASRSLLLSLCFFFWKNARLLTS